MQRNTTDWWSMQNRTKIDTRQPTMTLPWDYRLFAFLLHFTSKHFTLLPLISRLSRNKHSFNVNMILMIPVSLFHHHRLFWFLFWKPFDSLQEDQPAFEARNYSENARIWRVLSIRTERKNWLNRKKEIFIFFALVTLLWWWTVGWFHYDFFCVFRVMLFCHFVNSTTTDRLFHT